MNHKIGFAIEIKNASVVYGENVALKNASISIPFGSFSGVIGMNGAGKSTLFKLIMGLVPATSGKVYICGDEPTMAQKHGHVAYVPQTEVVDWDFPVSVAEVVMMGRLGLQGMFKAPSNLDHQAVSEALLKVKMLDFAERQIGELSGGQKKRVFVARALAQGADIFLLDEPFAGLDSVSERSVTELLVTLKEEGKTIILATHDLTSLSENCDYVALVKKTVIAYGPTKEVFTEDLVTQTFDGLIHRIKFSK